MPECGRGYRLNFLKGERSMKKKIYYLNKDIRRKLFFLEILFVSMSLTTGLLFYVMLPYPKSLLIVIPLAIFALLRLFFFFRNKKALFFDKNGIYTYRSGWVYWGEIKKIFMKDTQRPFVKKQKCLFFDVDTEEIYEKPLLSVEWPLYLLPSNVIVVCESDIDEPLEQVLVDIEKYRESLGEK